MGPTLQSRYPGASPSIPRQSTAVQQHHLSFTDTTNEHHPVTTNLHSQYSFHEEYLIGKHVKTIHSGIKNKVAEHKQAGDGKDEIKVYMEKSLNLMRSIHVTGDTRLRIGAVENILEYMKKELELEQQYGPKAMKKAQSWWTSHAPRWKGVETETHAYPTTTEHMDPIISSLYPGASPHRRQSTNSRQINHFDEYHNIGTNFKRIGRWPAGIVDQVNEIKEKKRKKDLENKQWNEIVTQTRAGAEALKVLMKSSIDILDKIRYTQDVGQRTGLAQELLKSLELEEALNKTQKNQERAVHGVSIADRAKAQAELWWYKTALNQGGSFLKGY
ncbi:hypothetical protein T439DRAFT_356377 [Meredithblackwellia eburnea MCA 4105]